MTNNVTDPNEAPDGARTNWTAPPERQGRPWLLLALLLLAAILIGVPLGVVLFFNQSEPGPELQSLGFGTGGSGCNLTDQASSFPVGVPIRVVLTLEPALRTGGTARFTIAKDGSELTEMGETISVTEPAPCIHGTLPELEVGHYRVQYAIDPSAISPIRGEFDVTRADGPSGVPTAKAIVPLRLVGIGEAVAVVDDSGAQLGTAAVLEAREPVPDDVMGFVPAAGNRLIVVRVRYIASAPWETNMFDWAMHDEAGRRYDPTGFGPTPIVVTKQVAPNEAFEGWVGFEVPSSASVWIDMLDVDRSTLFSVDLGRQT